MTARVLTFSILLILIVAIKWSSALQCGRLENRNKDYDYEEFSLDKYKRLTQKMKKRCDDEDVDCTWLPDSCQVQMKCWMRMKRYVGRRIRFVRGELMHDSIMGCSSMMNFGSRTNSATGHYNDNVECRWIFVNEGRNKFSLTYTKFDLEESSGCSHDYVQVRYLKPSCKLIDAKPLKFCGCGSKIPKDMLDRFAAKAVEVTFVTDGSVTRPGFMATLTRIEIMQMIVRSDEAMGMSGELMCSRVTGYRDDCNNENSTDVYKPKVMIVTKRMVTLNETHMKMTVNTKRLAKAMRMFNEYEGNCCNFDMSLMESMDSVMEGPTDWPTQPPVTTIPKLPPDEIGPSKSEE